MHCLFNNDTNEVVIPAATLLNEEPCTAIFNLTDFSWTKVANDNRQYPNSGRTIKEGGKLYYLGGLDEGQ